MSHAELPDWRGKVITDFLLFGIEADTLADELGAGLGGAGCAPYRKRHFEANCWSTWRQLGGTSAAPCHGKGCVESIRRAITPHIEALHRGHAAMVGCLLRKAKTERQGD